MYDVMRKKQILQVFHENYFCVENDSFQTLLMAKRKLKRINVVEKIEGRTLPLKADLPLQVLFEKIEERHNDPSKQEIAEDLV